MIPIIIRLWGLCDLAFIMSYLFMALIKGRIPILHDYTQAFRIADSFQNPMPVLATSMGFLLYISIGVSGYFLYQRNRLGAIISYAQLPSRLALAMPSLFFIYWPLTYIKVEPSLALGMGFSLLIFSESLKIMTLVAWRREAYSTI